MLTNAPHVRKEAKDYEGNVGRLGFWSEPGSSHPVVWLHLQGDHTYPDQYKVCCTNRADLEGGIELKVRSSRVQRQVAV